MSISLKMMKHVSLLFSKVDKGKTSEVYSLHKRGQAVLNEMVEGISRATKTAMRAMDRIRSRTRKAMHSWASLIWPTLEGRPSHLRPGQMKTRRLEE